MKGKSNNLIEEQKISINDSSPILQSGIKKKLTITRVAERDSDDDFDFNRQYSAPVNGNELANMANNESPGLSNKSNGSIRAGRIRHRGS